jgi:4-amino-4-deoxy-L-arabinose transferase-like glycosyltransferase
MILTAGVLWEWCRKAFGGRAAWWTLLLLVSMPSLPWLSSWAYTDLALAFFVLSSLYSLWRWSEMAHGSWLVIGGVLAGMAMGIKYTSFMLPVLCLPLILIWESGGWRRIASASKFAFPALIVAAPWYLRNWLVMGNPFYPFLFKGLYWDAFQSAWYAGTGTGIGWNLAELFLLPFKVMMGINDQNYFDGRMGPLFLLLLPLAVWAAWSALRGKTGGRRTMLLVGLFGAVSMAAWILGVIQTAHLWQARLLWPGLIPLAIPMGLALARLPELDLPRLRFSFILTALAALVVLITLVDNSLSLVFRRPLAFALGMESRQAYFERIQPRYAAALELAASTPPGSYIYLMFEPRSYGMPRRVQADPINDNLLHDFYLYQNAEGVMKAWQSQGFTHALMYLPGKEPAFDPAFDQVLPYLRLEAEKDDYQLYSISP